VQEGNAFILIRTDGIPIDADWAWELGVRLDHFRRGDDPIQWAIMPEHHQAVIRHDLSGMDGRHNDGLRRHQTQRMKYADGTRPSA